MKFGSRPDGVVQIIVDDVTIFVCHGRDVLYARVDNSGPAACLVVKPRQEGAKEIGFLCRDQEMAGKGVEYVMSKMVEDQK